MEIQRKLPASITIPAIIKKWGFDLPFCLAMISVAIMVGLRATASGPGISSDSVSYISMGENIIRGNGFVSDLANAFDAGSRSPVTLWPPGYSLLIAGLMVFVPSSLEAAGLVTILCFALLLAVVYWVARNLAGRGIAVLCSLAVLALMPVLRAATFALSEMPFILFSTLAVAGFVQSAKVDPARRWPWLMLSAASTSFAVLTRYIGVIWIPVGVLALGLVEAGGQDSIVRRLLKVIQPALGFTLVSLVPILPWFARNIALTGTPTGFNRLNGYHPPFVENVRFAFSTLAHELIPSIHLGLRSLLSQGRLLAGLAVLFFLLLCAGAAFLVRKSARQSVDLYGAKKKFFDTLQETIAWFIPALYCAVYLVGAVLLASTQQFPVYDWPRILVVIYPLILVVLLCSWARLIRVVLWTVPGLGREFAAVLPALLLIIPYAVQSTGFVTNAARGQELSTAEWRENQGIRYLQNTANPGDEIYSDKPAGVSYRLDRPARYLPYVDEYSRFSAMISGSKPGGFYIIVFKGELGQPDPYLAQRLSAVDIARLAAAHSNMQLVADFPDSAVYRVH